MKPAIPIFNPAFKYTPAANTDIRKRFREIAAANRRKQEFKPNLKELQK